MNPRERRIFLIVAGALLLVAVAVAGLAYQIHRAGAMVVQIEERRPGGIDVCIRFPAILAQVGLRAVPDEAFASIAREAREWIPMIRATVREAGASPDCVFVEGESAGEAFQIAKRGGRFLVRIDSPEERVRIELPVSAVESFVKRLEQAG